MSVWLRTAGVSMPEPNPFSLSAPVSHLLTSAVIFIYLQFLFAVFFSLLFPFNFLLVCLFSFKILFFSVLFSTEMFSWLGVPSGRRTPPL